MRTALLDVIAAMLALALAWRHLVVSRKVREDAQRAAELSSDEGSEIE